MFNLGYAQVGYSHKLPSHYPVADLHQSHLKLLIHRPQSYTRSNLLFRLASHKVSLAAMGRANASSAIFEGVHLIVINNKLK